jgi:hypothetical protein
MQAISANYDLPEPAELFDEALSAPSYLQAHCKRKEERERRYGMVAGVMGKDLE